jgi:hypothetical protein
MIFYVLLLFLWISQGAYDPTFSLLALRRAYVSYCTSVGITNWNCYWCDNDIKPQGSPVITPVNGNTTNTFSYIFQENGVIWIVVRGTQVTSIDNWVHNVDFVLTPLFGNSSSIQVHQGFKKDTDSLYPGILLAVRSRLQECPGCSILLVGHSLGGAISSIVALKLRQDLGPLSIAEWSYGSPRTGNAAFAASHKGMVSNSWRVVNMKDIVPHVPTKWFNIFQHVSTEVWYQSNYVDYKVCNGSGEDSSCSDSVTLVSITDHLTYFGLDLRNGHSNGCS